MAKLCSEITYDPVTIRKALLNLQSEVRLFFTADSRGKPINSYITVSPPGIYASELAIFRRTMLEDVGFPDTDICALSDPHGTKSALDLNIWKYY